MEFPSDLLDAKLAPYALAIGALCMEWAELESKVQMLFMVAAKMPGDRASIGISASVDFRDQLTAIKIAFVDAGDRKGATTIAIGVVDFIDNTLRPRRNRLVHDAWHSMQDPLDGREAVERIDWTPKIGKAQSFSPIAWQHVRFDEEDVEDIWTMVRLCRAIGAETYRLQHFANGNQSAIESLLLSPPKLHLPRRQSETRDQKAPPLPKHRPPPAS